MTSTDHARVSTLMDQRISQGPINGASRLVLRECAELEGPGRAPTAATVRRAIDGRGSHREPGDPDLRVL